MTRAGEYRELDDDELENKLINARKEVFNLRFQAATGRLDNSARTGQVKRDIARLLTIQQAREAGRPEGRAERTTGRGRRRRSSADEEA